MTLWEQIMWGSIYLGACLIFQTIMLSIGFPWMRTAHEKSSGRSKPVQVAMTLTIALAVIVFSHTVQIWLWAGVWIINDILPDWNTAIYFSMVTYTSVGYGDIVLDPPVRIFGTFATVTGMLGFGISAAVLVALLSRMFAEQEREDF